MKYPCLVSKQACKTPVVITIYGEGNSEDGEPQTAVAYTGMCNYQDKAKTILTKEKRTVQITGTALFPGDIAPDMPVIPGGTAEVFGETRNIVQGTKARNIDGTVNYTRIDLE